MGMKNFVKQFHLCEIGKLFYIFISQITGYFLMDYISNIFFSYILILYIRINKLTIFFIFNHVITMKISI